MLRNISGLLLVVSLMTLPGMADAGFIYQDTTYWWVEQTGGCGAGDGQTPAWLFTSSSDIEKYYSSGVLSKWHHNYTVPDTGVDAWRIRFDSTVCLTTGSSDDFNDWEWIDHDGSSWFWNQTLDYEGYKGWYDGQFTGTTCYYRGEEKNGICNRSYATPGVFTNYAFSHLYGYDFNIKEWEYFQMKFNAPPAL